MILSASYRCDIPAFFGPWFLARLAEGEVVVPNPYGGRPSRVSLRPDDVDGFVFWTRNARPFLPALERVAELGIPFVIHYTMTGLPAVLDGATPPPAQALAVMAQIRRRYGAKALVWRYDPIVFSSLTEADHHRATFAALGQAVARDGLADEVVMSVLQPYRKAVRRLDRLTDLSWRDPAEEEKRALLTALAAIARDLGLRPSLCAQPALLGPGLTEAACVDGARLSAVAGRAIATKPRPHRSCCGCVQSRDIGGYDSCAHGCVYCYAVGSQERARRAVASHAPFPSPPAEPSADRQSAPGR
ncbi:DNA repair photolyase [Rhodospirillum rubrum]|uniref:DUF1848 domain-containing protein n=1 Tax=Rhodospirillum rubrum TaxID=1085 RepID=UPI00190335C5|nr:DUF1848 domain-containing protein [Rhodospirillum rubrum]MBK1665414.1 DNA repair photolyase [Rhodospirillum rubrum]MBK1677347.1 DNA repair photolyase [Rhodospirillum rubrum]